MKSQKWIRLGSRTVAVDPAVGIANAAFPLLSPCPGRCRRSGTNQAIGRRWPLLAWAFGSASCVPRVNAALFPRGKLCLT